MEVENVNIINNDIPTTTNRQTTNQKDITNANPIGKNTIIKNNDEMSYTTSIYKSK